MLAAADEDDGYASPEFDLPSESEDEPEPPTKRARGAESKRGATGKNSLAADEELALQLLRSKR